MRSPPARVCPGRAVVDDKIGRDASWTGTGLYNCRSGVNQSRRRPPVVQLPFSEVITIDRHLDVGELRSYLNTTAPEDLRDSATPSPSAADERGRSTQQFVVDVVVRHRSGTRRISSVGRDIYAVTAPIVVEGAVRLLDGHHRGPGAMAPGQAFDAAAVLATLERDTDGFVVRRDWPSPRVSGTEL